MQIIFIRKFKDQFLGLIYYLAGLLLYSWMIFAIFPMVNSVKGAYLEQMPEQFLKFMGANNALSLSTIEGFISLEFLSIFFILIVAFYIGSSSGSIIAGTIEKRTIDFQLSQPISRTKLIISEAIAGLLGTAILVIITSISMFIFSRIYDTDLSNKGILSFSVIAIFFLWSFYGIGLIISSLLKTKITVAAVMVSLILALYILNAMTKIVDKYADYSKYTLFDIYNPQDLLATGHINWNHIALLATITVVGFFSAILIFNKKDL